VKKEEGRKRRGKGNVKDDSKNDSKNQRLTVLRAVTKNVSGETVINENPKIKE